MASRRAIFALCLLAFVLTAFPAPSSQGTPPTLLSQPIYHTFLLEARTIVALESHGSSKLVGAWSREESEVYHRLVDILRANTPRTAYIWYW